MKVKIHYGCCDKTVERNLDARLAVNSRTVVEMKRHGVVNRHECPECKRDSLTRVVNDLNEDALRRIVLANLTNRQVADSVRMEYLKRIDRLEQFNSTNR